MKLVISRFLADEQGATAIEYALIAAGIGIAIITAVNALGTAISGTFDNIKASLN
jgi:pilus assembly protein Flp/PilA